MIAVAQWLRRRDTNRKVAGSIPDSGVPRGVLRVSNPPPPEIPKALQNRAKLNPTVKTVKKLLNLGRQHPQDVRKKNAVKF